MRLPARFFLAVLTLSIATLTPIAAPPSSLASSNVSDCCVKMDAAGWHRCPRRLGAMKVVAEFLDNTQEEDLMKYLLMIATLAAFISTATATSPAADCCKGKAKCCPGQCCKK